MARLSIGDRVMDVRGGHEGRLVDIDGATAYVLQPNGVEIEFQLDQLKPYEALKEPAPGSSPTAAGGRALTAAQRALLASVPASIRNAVAQSYDRGGDGGSRPAFAALPDERKLETIRIYLPTLPRQVLSAHLNLVVAFRDIAKAR